MGSFINNENREQARVGLLLTGELKALYLRLLVFEEQTVCRNYR